MSLKTIVAIAVGVLFVIETKYVHCSRRDAFRQVTRLEKRFELENSLIKEEIEDLWTSFEQTHTECCASSANTSIVPKVQRTSKNTSFIPAHYHNIIHRIKQAFTEEKTHLREQMIHLQEELAKMGENWEDAFEELSNFNVKLLTKSDDATVDITKVQMKASELSARLDRLETQTGEQINGLSALLNDVAAQVKSVISNYRPASCMDLIKAGITVSGVYQLYYVNQPFMVYCLMNGQSGYTFISPDTYMNIDIQHLSNDQSHVVIRHRRTDGRQYHTRIEQMTRFMSRPISVQYNKHVGYKGIVNPLMSPYIYVGINPLGGDQKRQTQGYRANGKDVTFTNCDGNPNGYFAFLFNHGGHTFSNKGQSPHIARKWIDVASLVTKDIVPDKFMSKFELHFGGCGAYATNDHFRDVTMATVGVPYTVV